MIVFLIKVVAGWISYLCDPPDILIAICLRETQILVQAKAHIVAVETVRSDAEMEQVLLKRRRDSRLS